MSMLPVTFTPPNPTSPHWHHLSPKATEGAHMTERADDPIAGMDELDIAEAIRDGTLSSPQVYQNIALFKIRITGTGAAYRAGIEEHVWRSPDDYLNERFVRRCGGLPVLWEHPESGSLSSKEFADRVVGTVMFAFIEGEDVMGIAKIYDDEAIKGMMEEQLSTSPGVVLRSADSETIKLKGGGVLLIEGVPMVLDHVAICEAGVWDKGGPPTGVVNDLLERVDSMAESDDEKQARLAAEKERDAKLDKILTFADSMAKRQDALELRMDEDKKEREDKARKDEDEAADKKAKADAEEKEKADAKAKADADEEEEKKKEEEEDKKKAKADEDEESEEEKEKKKKEEEDKKADAARADSAAMERTFERMLAAREKRNTDSPEDRETKARIQSRADAVYNMLGQQAPPPMAGETSSAYRVRMLKGVQRHSGAWKEVRLDSLENNALSVAETQIYADAQAASRNPTDLPDDRLVTIPMRDPVTGLTRYEFRGKQTIFRNLSRPSSRVTGMRTGKQGE